ncbi:4841_t:CDS:1, partial [Scutellospora calospora]
MAKYIILIARKPPTEAYNFGQRNNDDDSIQRDWEQFRRRLDFIIEFKGKCDDDIEKRTTEIIFHQRSEEDFRNMNWMVKLRNGIHTNEEVIEKSKKINNDGEHIVINDEVYYKQKFSEFKKQYLQDYPKSRKLYKYQLECEEIIENSLKRNNIEV